MKVIITGCGTVGFNLAKQLSKDGHDITIIDRNADILNEDKIEKIDVLTIHGNGGSPEVLTKAGIDTADLLVAVTGSDETNILASIIASTFGVERRVARVRSMDYFPPGSLLQPIELGIDLLLNPEHEAADIIIDLLLKPYVSEHYKLFQDMVELIAFDIKEDSLLKDKQIKDVDGMSDYAFRIPLIIRDEEAIIPFGNNYIREKDRVYLIAETKAIDLIAKDIAIYTDPIKNVIIAGGTVVGKGIIKKLEKIDNISAKVIEADKKTCYDLTENVIKPIVINGDVKDADFLKEEGIRDVDSFVTVTDNEETNVLSSLFALKMGVKKVITLILRPDSSPLVSPLGLCVVSLNRISEEKILRFVRGGKIMGLRTLAEGKAELLEFVVKKDSKTCGKVLKDFKFPKDMVIAGIVRDGKSVLIATGNTKIQEDDRVLVFTLPNVKNLNKIF